MTRGRRIAAGVAALLTLTSACTGGGDGRPPFGSTAGTPASVASATGTTRANADGARFADPDTAQRILRGATAGIVAINSYDYRNLKAARANALRYVGDSLRDSYLKTFDGVVTANAQRLHAQQRATVTVIGVASASGSQASVLVFGTLRITTTDIPKGRVDQFSAVVRLSRSGDDWLLAKVDPQGELSEPVPGTAALADAVSAARGCVLALSSLRRASFDADFARGLACTTNELRDEVAKHRAAYRRTLDSGGFDLAADVRASAVVSADGDRAVVLVSFDGYKVTGARRMKATTQNVKASVSESGGRWRLTDLRNVGAQ